MKNIAALLYGRDDGHIDHIVPISSLLGIPLYITSKTLYEWIKEQYVEINAIYIDPNSVAQEITTHFTTLVTTLPRQLIDPIFLFDELTLKKRMRTYFLPHGASDKKNLSPLIHEDRLLIYGEKMKKMLPNNALDKTIYVGNFRLHYFLKHKEFYTSMVEKMFSFSKEGNLLYAPSWEYNVEDWITHLIAKKPKKFHLFIKLHPNTYKKGFFSALKVKYESTDRVTFIENFFPIYPLLSKIDALYTDHSSIGTDFLIFNKPLFFTEPNQNPLTQCGVIVDKKEPYPQQEISTYANARKELYEDVFKM